MRRWWRRWWRGRPRRVGKIRDAVGGASVFVSGAVVWDGVGVSGVWAAVLVGSGAVVGLAANMGAAMMARVVWGIPPVLLAWVFWYGLVLWAIAL